MENGKFFGGADNGLDAAIQAFAKANKISKAKLQAFAEQVQSIPTVKAPAIVDLSLDIRKAVARQTDVFTSAMIAQSTGADLVAVNNNLYSLQRAGLVRPTGEKIKTGGRGKPATVWQVIR